MLTYADASLLQRHTHTSAYEAYAYVSIPQHAYTSAYVSMLTRVSRRGIRILQHTRHTHTSAYVSMLTRVSRRAPRQDCCGLCHGSSKASALRPPGQAHQPQHSRCPPVYLFYWHKSANIDAVQHGLDQMPKSSVYFRYSYKSTNTDTPLSGFTPPKEYRASDLYSLLLLYLLY